MSSFDDVATVSYTGRFGFSRRGYMEDETGQFKAMSCDLYEALLEAVRAFEVMKPTQHSIGCGCFMCLASRGLAEFGELPERSK